MPDKSYVTLEACPICKKETGNLLLDRRLREVFEMHTINPTSVCEACKKQYLKEGIMLINPHTGSIVVLKEEAYKRIVNKPVPEGRIAFAEEEVLSRLMEEQKKAEKRFKEVV